MNRPIDFWLSSSRSLLQELELARLNAYRNIMKQVTALFEQAAQDLASAELARWLIENGPDLRSMAALDARQELLDFEGNNAVAEVAPVLRVVVGLPGNARPIAKLSQRPAVDKRAVLKTP